MQTSLLGSLVSRFGSSPSVCRALQSELPNQSDTRVNDLLMPLRIRSSLLRMPRNDANFEFGALVATVVIAAAVLMPSQARAASLAFGPGSLTALDSSNNVQQVRYVCRRVWRCTWGGCGWRRTCSWRPGRYYRYSFGFHPPYFGGHDWFKPRRGRCYWRRGRRVC
jgi:hypothetical protein